MESVFANDTTTDLHDMLSRTIKRREDLLDEVESCTDCLEDLNRELTKRANNGQTMEFVGVSYNVGLVLFIIMLKEESMKQDRFYLDGSQSGGLIDQDTGKIVLWPVLLKLLDTVKSRYRPVESTVLTKKADKKYYKLYNGDILDLDTKTILDQDSLKAMITAL